MTPFQLPPTKKPETKTLTDILIRNGFTKDVAAITAEAWQRKVEDPRRMAAAEETVTRDIANREPLSGIDHVLEAFSWSVSELRDLEWFDESNRLTPLGRHCLWAVRVDPGISDRHRKDRERIERPALSAPFPGFATAPMMDRLFTKEDSEVYRPFYTYEGPDEKRIAFMQHIEKMRGEGVRMDERHLPFQASVRPEYEHLTNTKATYDEYMYLGQTLDRQYRKEMALISDLEINIDLVDFSAWFMVRVEKMKWSKKTVIKYRAAITLWVVSVYGQEAAEECPLLMSHSYADFDGKEPDLSMQEREERRANPGKPRGSRGPALKKRFFHRDHLRAVIYYLRNETGSKYARILEAWLLAGCFTGLRPGEWRLTSIVVGEKPVTAEAYTVLHVMNGKATNGRADGVVRTLDITRLSPDVMDAVRYMSDIGFRTYQEGEEAYELMHRSCSNLLDRACKAALGKGGYRYSLYSCRHQFIANAKALMMEHEEISAMAGHKDVMVAMEHYGRKMSGWDTDKLTGFPRPTEDQVKRLYRYTDAKAAHNVRYANVMASRRTVVTDRMLDTVDF